MKIPTILQELSHALQQQNAKAIVVGGAVRDHFLQLPIKDYDVEVYGLEDIESLEAILLGYGSVNLVGKSFGILKFVHEGEEYDFSFPRTEQKIAAGHRGFEVACDGRLSFKQAAKRRDFTINAMGYDIERGVFIDPYGGHEDIRAKVLRHVDAETFVEDPLRLYRAVQFVARFGYRLDLESLKLSQEMVAQGALEELPKERVYAEFQQLLLKSPKPSIGFELMHKLGILRYYPELNALIGVPQSPKWHPEGDVWRHTLMAIDQMAGLKEGESKRDLKLMLAVLCHDFGKATHTQIEGDKITAIGHERAGVAPTERFLYRLMEEHDFVQSILPLVAYHLAPSHYYRHGAKDSTIRKLALNVNIEELVMVARADFLGRTTPKSRRGVYEAGDWLLAKAKALQVEKAPPKPLIQGRDLIAMGLKPSKLFKSLLDAVYLKQLNGEISDKNEALIYLKTLPIIT